MADKKPDDQLNRALESLLDGLEKSKDFMAEQIPIVVQELIVWKRVWFTSECVILLLIGLLAIYMMILFVKWDKLLPSNRENDTTKNAYVGGWVLSSLTAFCSLCIALPIAFYWASMVWFAPRVYILEYISSMARGH